jgi:hypothetical protein
MNEGASLEKPPPLPQTFRRDGWFLEQEGNETGPWTDAELEEKFREGILVPNTLVWQEGMEDWVPANEVPLLEQRLWLPEGLWLKGPHPWRRFWARQVDLTLGALLVDGMIKAAGLSRTLAEPWPLLTGTWVTCVLFESLWIHWFATTPGKWLLRLVVTDSAGRRPSLGRALGRTILVWVRGLAMLIPIVSLGTMIWAHRTLMRRGMTSWDRDLQTEVHHRPSGPFRWSAAAVILGIYFIYSFSVAYQRLEEQRRLQAKEQPMIREVTGLRAFDTPAEDG